MVPPYGDAGVVWVLLLGEHFTYNRCVGNFFPEVLGCFIVVYDVEAISAVNYFYSAIHTGSNSLA